MTSLGQLDQDGLRLLDATQQKNLKSIFKAEQLGEYDNDTYLDVLTNTAALKGMPQKEFKGLLMRIPPNARESLAKDYARVKALATQLRQLRDCILDTLHPSLPVLVRFH